jgi:DNA-directed RNA polymerase subunit beta'
LKENVIVGRLIPAGTGLAYHKNRRTREDVNSPFEPESVVAEPVAAAEAPGDEQVA